MTLTEIAEIRRPTKSQLGRERHPSYFEATLHLPDSTEILKVPEPGLPNSKEEMADKSDERNEFFWLDQNCEADN